MIDIKNKKDCLETISRLGLNRLPEQFFSVHEGDVVAEVKKFIKKYPFKLYAIRDKARMNGVFKFNVKREDLLEEIKNYEVFTVNVSSSNYAGAQMLTGDIEITSDNKVYAILSFDPNESVRGSYSHPDCILNCDIFDDAKLKTIPDFDYIFDYFVKHGLIDVVVELSLFSCNVGVNNERIIIWELRNKY